MIHHIRARVAIVFFSFCMFYGIIVFNLFLIQIWHAHFFSTLGEQQYNVTISQPAPRAPIVDRTGKHYLAMNKECVSAFIIPNQLHDKKKLSMFLETHFPTAYERLNKKLDRSFMYIKRRLTPEEQEAITQANLPDIHLLCEMNRFYPLPSASPLIGFTDIDNHGVAGIELSCEKQLAGIPMKCALEKEARSGYFYFKKELVEQGQQGEPVILTIDSDLQFQVDQELAQALQRFQSKQAAAIIMNPTNGEILAMSSYPHVDINNPESFDLTDAKQRVVTESYELGSVIKVFAALAALQEGVVTADELIDCKNAKTCYINGRKINTWKAHGTIPFSQVVAFSNNIGIAQVAKRLDAKIYDHYCKLGFGKKTGIAIPAESAGFVNHPKNWSKQSIISLSYGYEISATILQLARAFCMIAQDGKSVEPRLLLNKPSKESTQLYDPKVVAIIKDILRETTQEGTGWRTKIEGYDILSKTGTANILENGVYNDQRNLFTCAAIIQKGDYKRVIVTFIKEANVSNAFASTIAAPVLKSIAEKMIIHERAV